VRPRARRSRSGRLASRSPRGAARATPAAAVLNSTSVAVRDLVSLESCQLEHFFAPLGGVPLNSREPRRPLRAGCQFGCYRRGSLSQCGPGSYSFGSRLGVAYPLGGNFTNTVPVARNTYNWLENHNRNLRRQFGPVSARFTPQKSVFILFRLSSFKAISVSENATSTKYQQGWWRSCARGGVAQACSEGVLTPGRVSA
jgi:hypothetical protein